MHGNITLARERPHRTLGSLISLYESNYQRLMRLAPDLERIEGAMVSSVAGALDLHLIVHEREAHTTWLTLTYRFGERLQPNARIAVYHDVRSATLLNFTRRPRPPERWASSLLYRSRPRQPMPHLHQKWRANRFLQKWLGFCHHQGHLFLHATCDPVSPSALMAAPARTAAAVRRTAEEQIAPGALGSGG